MVDYRAKAEGVEHSQLVLPGGGTTDRERLWQAIDAYPTQKPTATIARDMIVAFPHELGFDERKAVALELAQWISDRYGVAVDLGMHRPDLAAGSNERNYHGHYLISERMVSASGDVGNVQRQLNSIVCKQPDPERGRNEPIPTAAEEIRRAWERIANDALERGGHAERVDCRSYSERGIDKTPGVHRGAAETRRMRAAAKVSFRASQAATELAELERGLRHRRRAVDARIDEIQRERRVRVDGYVQDHIGSLDAWTNDTLNQFLRAMASADRASRHRRTLRELDARHLLRHATKDQDAELRMLGRERRRAQKMADRVASIKSAVSQMSPDAEIEVSSKKTSARLREIELATKRRAEMGR